MIGDYQPTPEDKPKFLWLRMKGHTFHADTIMSFAEPRKGKNKTVSIGVVKLKDGTVIELSGSEYAEFVKWFDALDTIHVHVLNIRKATSNDTTGPK